MDLSKKPSSLNTQTRVLFSVSLIFIFIDISSSQFSNSDKTCALLHSKSEVQGPSFLLTDWDQSVNLGEDLRVSDEGWNVTNTIKVETGCQLQTCNETYFDGTCRSFQAGSHLLANFTEEIVSAKCVCEKHCSCSDVFVEKSSCGRAYLNGGCSTCDVPYINLDDANKYFPDEYMKKVVAFKLRKGCTLTIYTDTEFDGDETLIEREIVEDFNGVIGSYSCQCIDSMYEPRPTHPKLTYYPDLLQVPNSINDVINMMGSSAVYRNHTGLEAARTSYSNGRSIKNAYILLLGSSGAGKSSTINFIFENPNMTRVSDTFCGSKEIEEYRLLVPINNLGIANSELRVIEIPGLGDTRGLEQDAKILATLDDFLSTHEDLKDRLPNIILIFHKINDNWFQIEQQSFLSMLRGLNYFRKRITDQNYSNVIFVLSHFCSQTRKDKRNPEIRIKQFKDVIEEKTLFPKPIHLVVAENKAQEHELTMVNGFYKLPNNEYYPKNLFTKIELITKNTGDIIGVEVFRAGFRDTENLSMSKHTFNLVSNTTVKVEMFLEVLTSASNPILPSEVSGKLDEAWWAYVNSYLRRQFPDSLHYIQKALYLRNITTQNDIPNTSTDTAYFLRSLKWNEAIKILLAKGLNIETPKFPLNPMTGYNIFRDAPVRTSPFKMRARSAILANIGYVLPKVIQCKLDSHTKGLFNLFEDVQKYSEHRFKKLGIEQYFSPSLYRGNLNPGVNIITSTSDRCTLTATQEIRRFELVLDYNWELTSTFKWVVEALPPFNSKKYESVAQWRNFYNIYGTHVVQSVYGGGAVEIQVESDRACNQSIIEMLYDFAKFGVEPTYLSTLCSKGIIYSLKFIGGDHVYQNNNFTKLSAEEASNLLGNWKKSLKGNPVLLKTDMGLEAISKIMGHVGLNYTSEAEMAANHLFKPCSDYWINIIDAKARQAKIEEKRRIYDANMAQRHREFNLALEECRRKAADIRNMELLKAMMNDSQPKKQTCIIWGLACW